MHLRTDCTESLWDLMTYHERTRTYTLSTGRAFKARGGVIGLDAQYTEGRYVCEGYDR